ncbi:DUF1993 domain-containing protein [Sandaracinobacter neustonicus]|uniref:DUF1993 domain-containing protein n=1 Tax=Sandaracinobacter neustonicus TaxID=1715348 RepID=A0A501XDK4_9SPHN|nr:DUF1993 domain-containing protein [Sandaracinobacter neustonicus]TPE58612.1 DUF1993 domain-containing protein [Sandaracinobacter neustonicus]
MPISLYDAFVPTTRQMLGSVLALLDKAEGWCAAQGLAEAEIANASLHDSMLPFAFQIKSVARHSLGAIDGVREGNFNGMSGEMPGDFAGMKALLAKSDAGLAAVTVAEMESFIGKEVQFTLPTMKLPFTAENFLLSFSQPNFFFHATTAYAILRAKGVGLGKRDFLGQLRLKP